MSNAGFFVLALAVGALTAHSNRQQPHPAIHPPRIQIVDDVSMPVPTTTVSLFPERSAREREFERQGILASGPDHGPAMKNVTAPEATVDTLPVQLTHPEPAYTEEARAKGIEGTIDLAVLVGIDGEVKRAKLLGHHLLEGLDEQALVAAYRTKFKPATKDGKNVAFWLRIEIPFRL